jgi:hypothetical protein
MSVSVSLSAGQVIALYATNPTADVGDWQVWRLSVRRVADGFATAELREGAA